MGLSDILKKVVLPVAGSYFLELAMEKVYLL